MTIRLDLRTAQSAGLPRSTLINPTPFGCADCGRWFQFARLLVEHVCAERSTTMGDLDAATTDADEQERCISCGAEVDHHLGCPDDPQPDYEAEAKLQRPRRVRVRGYSGYRLPPGRRGSTT